MRLAAQTDVRHSLPRSRRFRCLCTRSDTVVSSKNLSKRRRPTPRYRNFQIDTKNGRLTPIRIVLARNILRAHPTLVPKRGCVSAPAMVPLWSGLFYCRALQRKAFRTLPYAGDRGIACRRATRPARPAACHLMLAGRLPERLARYLRMSREPSWRRSPLSGSCAPLHYEKLSKNPWRSSIPSKHGLIGHAHPRRPRAALLT